MNTFPTALDLAVRRHPYKMVFATISGAHLYGFPSRDSDYDLRGAHILPVSSLLGFETTDETVESSTVEEGLELDIVTHDIKKFMLLMLKRNGYVLEQLYSPLVVSTSSEHDELKALGKQCITRFHSHHYLGFARTQWRLFEKEDPPRIKPLLYVYRVLLTGIHLMESGEIQANITTLNERFGLPYIGELVERKVRAEHEPLPAADLVFHKNEYNRLVGTLEAAADSSRLPEAPTAKKELEDLLRRIRMGA